MKFNETLDKIQEIHKALEGTITVDENKNRWIFRNGQWTGMCKWEAFDE